MKWSSREKSKDALSGEAVSAELRACGDSRRFYSEALRKLLGTVKETLAEEPAGGAEKCVEVIDALLATLASETELKKIQPEFESRHRAIAMHLLRLKESFREKEAEYKEIIDILTKAMADIHTGNKDFTEKIFKQSEKLEQLSQLEDIRIIKSNLKQQVASLKTAVRDKQARDVDMIGLLSEQVTTLKTELEVSQQASFRDGLTGLYNEQALNQHLKTQVKPGADSRSPFSLLVVDIDNYDKIVETYSPELGQRVILAAGQECRNLFNRNEFVARYNKGTFVAILPAVPRKTAVRKAKKLCQTIAAKRYQIDEALSGHTLSFTVCIGVSTLKKGDTVTTVTSRAIQALYSARRSGPNHVVSEKTIFLLFKKGGTESLEDL